VRPWCWSRAVWDVFVRQLLFSAVDAVGFATRIAIAVGVMVVVQAEMWLEAVGQRDLLGPLLLNVLVREFAPLLANFVVIMRSGTAITTELANMRVNGEVDVLDSQGLDPMTYLVMPRVLAAPIAVVCLAVLFVVVSFASGYLMGVLLGTISGGPWLFFEEILGSVGWEELLFFVPKTLISGLFVGAICTMQGLSVRGAVTEVPQAVVRSAVLSLSAVFFVAAIMSLVIYGRFLIIQVV